MTPESLISLEYRETQRALHVAPRGYGGKGSKWAAAVAQLATRFRATTVLDYGCGSGSLALALRVAPLGLEVREYDPAIPGKHALPQPADLVIATDVLEHIEPDKLPAVFLHLQSLTLTALFVVIATRASNKTLSDGRNAHLILQDAAWWDARVRDAGFLVQPDPPVSPLVKPSREWVAVLTC